MYVAVSGALKELLTEEYGILKCEEWDLQEVDEQAKLRNDSVKFLGVYNLNEKRCMVFFVQNKPVLAAF